MTFLRVLPFAFAAVANASDAPSTAMIDVTLLPMDRPGTLPHQTVVTCGNLIVAIGPSAGEGAIEVLGDVIRRGGRIGSLAEIWHAEELLDTTSRR